MKRQGTATLIFLVLTSSTHPHFLQGQAADTAGLGPLRTLDSLRRAKAPEYEQLKTMVIVGAQMSLGRLGFGSVSFSGLSDSTTAQAVRRFERARGLPVTGDLFSRATFGRLSGDVDLLTQSEQRPSLGFKNFTWGDGWLIAEGPWYMEGEPETYMTAHIYCDLARSECRLAWAKLGPGVFTSRALQILTESFKVERWDEAEIISEPLDYPCTRYLLRINRLQETVVMTRSALSKAGMCSPLEVRDLVTRLVRPEDWPSLGAVGKAGTVLELYNFGPAARAAFSPKPR